MTTTYNVMIEIVSSNDKFLKAINWCKENFGDESITVDRMIISYYPGGRWTREYANSNLSTVVFKFINPDDATLFNLIWG